jgi:ABC-2 type transport system ATP-binding protein
MTDAAIALQDSGRRNDPGRGLPLRGAGVFKSFKRKTVLNGLDLEIPQGSVVGLLGKNGSGKTTFIKCALGLLRIDRGEMKLLGDDAWSLSASAKARLGYVPQIVTLYPWMRTGQLVDYMAPFYPCWNSALVGDLLRKFDVDCRAYVKTLSVGTLQKLAIILALGHEPQLLVLDEPAASLDPAARREFLKAILDIAGDQRRTVLFSTHITSDLERVADRVAILSAGKIIYHGELDELKDSVKRLHISASAPLPENFDVPGSLNCRREGTEAVTTIRGNWKETAGQIERDYGALVRVEDLNLEDIFLEIDHEPQHGANATAG